MNIEEPVELFEVGCNKPEHWEELSQLYEEALSDFENQNFECTASILGQALTSFPHDGPAMLLLSRAIQMLMQSETVFTRDWELNSK